LGVGARPAERVHGACTGSKGCATWVGVTALAGAASAAPTLPILSSRARDRASRESGATWLNGFRVERRAVQQRAEADGAGTPERRSLARCWTNC
jgi:hypothetical protein